jgi:diguanylate cyclase
MDSNRAANQPNPTQSAAALAKAAFKRLALAKLEPTPENYSRAYAEEGGTPPAAAPALPATAAPAAPADAPVAASEAAAWAALTERLARNLERGGKQWTAARRKESLKRVFDGSRSDAQRMQQRLSSLMSSWESDQPSDPAQTGVEDPPVEVIARPEGAPDLGAWTPLVRTLEGTVRAGLPPREPRPTQLADRLAQLADAVAAEGATAAHVTEVELVCSQARRLFSHRHHLIESLGALCQELSAGLTELTEDDSWAAGQCRVMQVHLATGTDDHAQSGEGVETVAARLTVRGVRAARTVLAETREQQQRVRGERQSARHALKQLIHSMLLDVGELGEHTTRFQAATARHAQAIQSADSLESLAGVVHALLADARSVQSAVSRSQEKLVADRARAEELEGRVRELESEMRRLSDEVSTDALTQVANRRGLMQAFETEMARNDREQVGGAEPATLALAVGLIDIDNFKRLNDTLGHAAGDTALKTLAAAVRDRLRPADHLARFGGEEFVVLLPSTDVEEGQQVLTRLQRSLTEALFLHEGREVFVTFSAGVTAWRPGEALQAALERADEALYEAKRTGKNRTCIG